MSSVEQSSTTISSQSDSVCSLTVLMTWGMRLKRLKKGTTTLTVGASPVAFGLPGRSGSFMD